MKLCTYYASEEVRRADFGQAYPSWAKLAIVRDGLVYPITDASLLLNEQGDWLDGAFERLAEVPLGAAVGPLEDAVLGCPVLRPRQFLDFYAFEQHVKTARGKRGLEVIPEWYELPAYYNSNALSLYGHGQEALYPAEEELMDFELEMACVIGTTIRNATPEAAAEAIAGYTILNDLSARARQRKAMKVGLGPSPGKDFGSALGPVMVTTDEIGDINELTMRASVNGEQWAEGRFGSIHYTFAEMIAYASVSRTFFPGDVIGSGTVGGGCGLEIDRFVQPGDVITLEIDGIGTLTTPVAKEG